MCFVTYYLHCCYAHIVLLIQKNLGAFFLHEHLTVSFLFSVLGYEVYLVGGCVRDLILKRTPKDFDIITSAELKEVGLNFYFTRTE